MEEQYGVKDHVERFAKELDGLLRQEAPEVHANMVKWTEPVPISDTETLDCRVFVGLVFTGGTFNLGSVGETASMLLSWHKDT